MDATLFSVFPNLMETRRRIEHDLFSGMFLPHCTGKAALLASLVSLALASWISLEGVVYTSQQVPPNLSPQMALRRAEVREARGADGSLLPFFDAGRWCGAGERIVAGGMGDGIPRRYVTEFPTYD